MIILNLAHLWLLLFSANLTNSKPPATSWKMIFSDEFKAKGNFDAKKWSYASRGNAAWTRYLTSSADYVYQDGGNLVVRMDNKAIARDDVPYHSGGVNTSGKFSFLYGKVEVRAKFKRGKGSWPAIWMMPEVPVAYGGWPASGEIDIMEQVNNENVVHQTVHNAALTKTNGASDATKSTPYNTEDYNIYGIVWEESKIEFYVNNVLTYTYTKSENATSQLWPYDKPYYLILNQAGGAGWPGPINDADLPFDMKIDWVRVYQVRK